MYRANLVTNVLEKDDLYRCVLVLHHVTCFDPFARIFFAHFTMVFRIKDIPFRKLVHSFKLDVW